LLSNRKTGTERNPGTLEALEPLKSWNPGTLAPWNLGTFESQGSRVSWFQRFRSLGLHVSKVPGLQASRVPGLQVFKVLGLLIFKVRIPVKIPTLQGSGLQQGSEVPTDFQGPRVGGLQGCKYPGFQGSRVAGGTTWNNLQQPGTLEC